MGSAAIGMRGGLPLKQLCRFFARKSERASERERSIFVRIVVVDCVVFVAQGVRARNSNGLVPRRA